jgi:hypothetical protein
MSCQSPTYQDVVVVLPKEAEKDNAKGKFKKEV